MPDREPQPQFDVRPANRMMCLRDPEGKVHVFGVQSTSVCWLAKLSVQVLAGQTVFIEKGALKIFSVADFGTSTAALCNLASNASTAGERFQPTFPDGGTEYIPVARHVKQGSPSQAEAQHRRHQSPANKVCDAVATLLTV